LNDDYQIREARPSDYAQWKVLWDGYNAFYGRKGDNALPEDVSRRTWARFFDGYEPVNALVADEQGTLIGLAHYIYRRSTNSMGPACYLQDLFTGEPARGKGVGRALIEEVYRRASAAGCASVYWHTHETNATAMRLYDKVAERSGFVVYRKLLEP
jgi:GNAT superfamily N-acetyltransferase